MADVERADRRQPPEHAPHRPSNQPHPHSTTKKAPSPPTGHSWLPAASTSASSSRGPGARVRLLIVDSGFWVAGSRGRGVVGSWGRGSATLCLASTRTDTQKPDRGNTGEKHTHALTHAHINTTTRQTKQTRPHTSTQQAAAAARSACPTSPPPPSASSSATSSPPSSPAAPPAGGR